jgi:hypothetical protein
LGTDPDVAITVLQKAVNGIVREFVVDGQVVKVQGVSFVLPQHHPHLQANTQAKKMIPNDPPSLAFHGDTQKLYTFHKAAFLATLF